MLEQLYFTWSTLGLGDVPGFRVRAATDALSDINGELYNSFKSYLNYNLPQGTDSYAATEEKSPFSLIFADTGKARVISQKVYKGKDGYNRPGVYFAHLLTGLSSNFLACDAIDLWKSPFWTTSDALVSPNSFKLEPIPPNVLERQKGILSERNIDAVQNYLPLVIQAYLTLTDTQKLYMAASNELVAALIWGLAHSLPRILQQTLTFSTYEFDVTKVDVRVVCTSQAESEVLKGYSKPAQILPTECYSGKGVAIDCYSGKTSDLKYVSPEIVDYSLYATNCFVNRHKKNLDELLATAERLNVKSIEEFLAVFKFYASYAKDKPLTEQEVTGLLGNGDLVTAILHRENVQRAIIDLAIANLTWWNAQAAPALTNLRKGFNQQAKEALAQFGMQVARELGAALLSQQTRTCTALMRVLYMVTPPNTDSRPWIELLESLWAQSAKDKSFHPAKAYNWEIRAWFLEQWAFGSQEIKEEHLTLWLQMSWSELESFLTIPNIPMRWHQLAIMDLLATPTEPLPKDLTVFAKNKEYLTIFVNALRGLMFSPQTVEAALRGFTKVAPECNSAYKLWLLATLLSIRELSAQELDAFLQAAQLDGKEKIVMIEEHCQLLLPPKSKAPASPVVVELLKTYLNKFSLDKVLKDPSPRIFTTLEYLFNQSKRVPDGMAMHIRDWLFVSDGILREPFVPLKLEAKSLKAMSEAITHLKLQEHKKYRESLFLVLIYSIKNNDELRCVYKSLTPTLAATQINLLYDLSALIGKQYTPSDAHTYLLPYIIEALSFSLSMQSQATKEKFLDPLLKALLQNADEMTFQKIEGEIKSWRKEYREEWEWYALAPRKGIWQRVGDVGNFIGGMRVGGSSPGAKLAGGPNRVPSGPLPNPPAAPSQDHPSQQKAQEMRTEPPKQVVPQVPTINPPVQQGGKGAPQGAQYTPPNNAQQQGGYQDPRPPYQNPPPQEFSPAMPYALNNASAPEPQPQSIVNGKPIYPKQIQAVFTLKGPYIEYRHSELNDIFSKHLKAKKDTKWILEEREELDNHKHIGYTLEALEYDVLINDALRHFGIDSTKLLDEVYAKVRKPYKAFGNHYNEAEIKNVLLIFVRYRLLAEHLRSQMSMKDWLIKQQPVAQIKRSPNPLPNV